MNNNILYIQILSERKKLYSTWISDTNIPIKVRKVNKEDPIAGYFYATIDIKNKNVNDQPIYIFQQDCKIIKNKELKIKILMAQMGYGVDYNGFKFSNK